MVNITDELGKVRGNVDEYLGKFAAVMEKGSGNLENPLTKRQLS